MQTSMSFIFCGSKVAKEETDQPGSHQIHTSYKGQKLIHKDFFCTIFV